MKDATWKPKKASPNKSSEEKPGTFLVELSVISPDAKKALEELIRAHGEFSIKQGQDPAVPQLLILEIDEDPEKTFSLIKTLLGSSKETEVFLTSSNTDSKVLLDALRAGMKEFLPQPIQEEEVQASLERFKERRHETGQGEKKELGRILALFGGKGGSGTTSLAVNIAAALQSGSGSPSVVVVDVNQHGGDIPLYLDLSVAHSFRDIAADLSRLDRAFLSSLLLKHESGLQILASGYDDLSSGRLSPDCIEPTLKLLQTMFDFVVIDCGHVLDLATKKALELASSILVVSQLIVPVVHRTKRILELLHGSGFSSEKIKLVVNRYLPQENELLAETEQVLKHKAAWLIPNDYMSVSHAINGGKPIMMVAPKAKLVKSIEQMAASYGQRQGRGVATAGSFWSSCLKTVTGKRSQPSATPA